MNSELIELLTKELKRNSGRISKDFVDNILNNSNTKVTHVKVTENTRVCVITLESGHELVGYSQVLDSKNDVVSIGEEVAYNNAKDKIWSILGSIAKVIKV